MSRLGVNLVYLNPLRMGGVETYVRALLREFHRMDLGGMQVVLFVGKDHQLEIDRGKFEVVECAIDPRHQYRRILWEQAFLPGILNRHHLDLCHFPYSAYPAFYGRKSVVTLNDSTRFLVPEVVPRAQRWYRAAVEHQIAAHQQHVIAVSQADAAVLRERLGLGAERTSVVYYGVAERFRVEKPMEEKGDYLLWTGRPYPHKGLATLLGAYAMLKGRGRDLPTLRLVGVEGGYQAQVEKWVDSAGVRGMVSIERPVRHEELPELVRRAKAFVFPSYYESFGLPVLEAMASGTATITSDIPAFKELFAPASVQFATHSAEGLAEAIDRVLSQEELRRELEMKGIEHAARFTWEACARETLAVYRRLLP